MTATPQGIGARVLRKEDGRFLHGRGNYVTDMWLPGQREVAFLRSPLAHARITDIRKPPREPFVFVRDDLAEALPILGRSGLPSYRAVAQHPLAFEKVRFVGEPVAMACAGSRAQAEDLLERVEIDFEELPALADALLARDSPVRVHDGWDDNVFVTLGYENGFEEKSRRRQSSVKREIKLSRQAMVPIEGKAVAGPLGRSRRPARRLFVPSNRRICCASASPNFSTLRAEQVRVIAPDVGGGFGYKYNLHPEELCVAWLALKFRRPFRYVEDRREHLVAGANTRQHHYDITGYADAPRRLLALDADRHDRRRRIFQLAPDRRRSSRPDGRQPARPVRFPRLSRQGRIASPPTSPAFCPIAVWRAPASASPWT